jgi:hypothetical protein|tara:strand:- start:1105 stop:1332 length:228 start_codon:yes stop_codon:yes gene_type:complete
MFIVFNFNKPKNNSIYLQDILKLNWYYLFFCKYHTFVSVVNLQQLLILKSLFFLAKGLQLPITKSAVLGNIIFPK